MKPPAGAVGHKLRLEVRIADQRPPGRRPARLATDNLDPVASSVQVRLRETKQDSSYDIGQAQNRRTYAKKDFFSGSSLLFRVLLQLQDWTQQTGMSKEK